MNSDYHLQKSFVDDEVFALPHNLDLQHVQSCVILPDRYRLLERLPKNANVAEIGVQAGKFSRSIIETCAPDCLHLFDISFHQDNHPFDFSLIEEFQGACSVNLHEGNSSEHLAKFPDYFFDWIYVDGDHSYDGVVRDIEQATRKIRPDGIIVFNDYAIYSPLEKTQYGVQRAVNDLMLGQNFEMIYFALSTSGYHDVAVRRQEDTEA